MRSETRQKKIRKKAKKDKTIVQHTEEKIIFGQSEKPVCATNTIYTRALLHFSDALSKRILYHEEEVFVSRAYFGLKRAQDREHFDRTQRKRLQSGSVSGNLGQHSVESAIVVTGGAEEQCEDEKMFTADQEKLYIEHEEMLQQTYPLAFLDETSLTVLVSELMPRLQCNLETLARERTQRYEERQDIPEKSKNLFSAPNVTPQSTNCGETLDVINKRQEHLVKKEHDPSVTVTLGVGRGAYIIPKRATYMTQGFQMTANEVNGDINVNHNFTREEGVENEACQPHGQREVNCDNNNNLSAEGVTSSSWLSCIKSRGAAMFAGAALLCNEQARRERREERRMFFESCLREPIPIEKQPHVRQLLASLKEDRQLDAVRETRLKRLWHVVMDKFDDGKNSVVDNLQKESVGGKSNDIVSLTNEQIRYQKTLKGAALGVSCSPTAHMLARRRKHMECLTSINNQNNANSAAIATSPASNFIPSALNNSCSHDIFQWETINLGDDTVNNGNNENNFLEAKVQSYMWPQHIEEKIVHVMCGKVVSGKQRCLMFKQELPATSTQEETENTCDEHDNGRVLDPDYNEEKYVLAFPRRASNVWLKIDSLGDFIAGTVAVVKESAMSRDLQQDCIDCAAHALHVLGLREQTAIAQFIVQELNSKHGSRFHCIVGRSFGSYVGHDGQYFVYFLIGDCAFLIWRTSDTYEERVFYVPVNDIAIGALS